MRKLLFLGYFTIHCFLVDAQVNRNTFPLSREFKKSGFSISPLATVSFGNASESSKKFENGYEFKFEEEGRGTWNAGVELSWFKTFEGYKVGDYFEAALSYRRFSGVHYLTETITVDPTNSNLTPVDFENSFTIQKMNFSFRAIDIAFQKPNRFLTWGFGLNYEYLLANNYSSNDSLAFQPTLQFQDQHAVQVHFQIGYGIKVSKFLRVVPTLETPIVGFLPSAPNPGIQFFDIHYQPLVIGLKFMFLRKDPVNCNAPQLKNPPAM